MKWTFGLSRAGRGKGVKQVAPESWKDDSVTHIRAGTYTLLGELLSFPPTEKRLKSLARINVARADSHMPLAPGWEALREAAASTDVDTVADEFRALFAWGGRGRIMPFASWYLTGELMDQPPADLRFDLMSLGIEPREGSCATEDHAGALCDVMGMIVACPEEFEPASQEKIFRRYLEPWIGRFFADLQETKPARFYHAVGEFGQCFIEIEKQYFTLLQ
ncbi:MAG: molecular chaperone TorD family protein [Pseudomonadota bacterium]|nr:molecular chaperone TorD family protein [Pseudomonadota bacterium]